MEEEFKTFKINVYVGNGKRVACKIKHAQIYDSNVVSYDPTVDGGIVIYYRGKEFKFSIPGKAIQYFGFLGNVPAIYCNNKIFRLELDKIVNDELEKVVNVIEKDVSYSRWISLYGKVYLEKWLNGEVLNYVLSINEETGVVDKKEISKEHFTSIVVKEKTIKEFLHNNLISVNNTIINN